MWERPNGGHQDEQPHRTRRGLPALPRPRLGRGPSSSQVEARGWHCSSSRAAAQPRRRPPGCSPAPTVSRFSLGLSLPACKRGTPAHPAPECAPSVPGAGGGARDSPPPPSSPQLPSWDAVGASTRPRGFQHVQDRLGSVCWCPAQDRDLVSRLWTIALCPSPCLEPLGYKKESVGRDGHR